jgi:AraC-like DNA-binding protein
MSDTLSSVAPKLIAMRTLAADAGATYEWHSHPFEEFTLVTDDACLIGHPPGWRDTSAGTLLHYHAGERHGAWTSPQQRPRFWVIHFSGGSGVYQTLTHLLNTDAAQRAWALKAEQLDTMRWLFLQLLNEHSGSREDREAASSAWLQLLLVMVNRWASRSGEQTAVIPSNANAEVLRLWHLVNGAVSKPNDELEALYAAPNYDSVRHAFRATFGMSPRAMLQHLRMEHAKSLLLETSLSIKEIAARVGYLQQHDFNRMFNRYAGIAPSRWRANPLGRKPSR